MEDTLSWQGQDWPSERKGLILQVSVVASDVPPFIYGCNGHITSTAMDGIERQLADGPPEEPGDYLYEAFFEKGDETCAPYWELNQIGFRALPIKEGE